MLRKATEHAAYGGACHVRAPSGLELHGHGRGVSGLRLIDGVVDNLRHEVVQPLLARGADVHARPLADGLEAL